MALTIDLSVFTSGTYTFEDDGIAGNNRSVVLDQNGNVVATFDHPADSLTVVSKAGQSIVLNFTDSLGAANFTVGTSADPGPSPSPNPDSIQVQNVVTTGIVTFGAGTISESGSDAAADVVAGQLSMTATAGIGAAANALETQVSRLEGETDTGGIYIENFGDVEIRPISSAVRGLNVHDSGDLLFTNHGTITINLIATDKVAAGALSGDLTLTALGATADIVSNANIDAFKGDIAISVGRDAMLHGMNAGGSLSAVAVRDLQTLHASAGNPHGGDLVLTAGRDLTVREFGALSNVAPGGDVVLSAGPDGLLRFGTAHAATLDATGDIIFNADRVAITPVTVQYNVRTGGTMTIQPVTAGRAIDIGSTTDNNANALELSDGDLDRLQVGRLVIGNSQAGAITVTAPVFLNETLNLDLLSGGDVDFLASIGFTTGGSAPRQVTVLAGDDFTSSAALTRPATSYNFTVDAFGGDPGVGGVLTITGQVIATSIVLAGNEDPDTLIGSAADEFLIGGGGADTMRGGAGNDVYRVDNAGDVVVELAGEGVNDLLFTTLNWTLTDDVHVESLATDDWLATDPISLTGNGLNNYLIGNAGANVLNGGAGADILVGREGNDVYIVDNAGDGAFENAGQGIDAVYSAVSYSLNDSNEVETLSTLDWNSTASLNLTGNSLANYMIGNAGVNVLDGKAGADILVGKGGNDIYIVDHPGDFIAEAAGEGNDGIYTSTSYALAADSDVETLATLDWNATTAIDLTGNAFNNYLIGNAGANVLNGGAGGDVLDGKGGADSFAFTSALDGGSVDLIVGFAIGNDRILLDDAVFTGLAPGALNPNAFVIGSAAGDADDRIVYNSATGQLFFDADGSGSGAAVLFAILDGHPALAASDFTVI